MEQKKEIKRIPSFKAYVGRHDEEECVKRLEHVFSLFGISKRAQRYTSYFYFAAEILIIDSYYYYLFSFNKLLRVSRANFQLLSQFPSLLAISCDLSIKCVSPKHI